MKPRQGLTLFEVVISLGIFLVSMAGLYQLLDFTNDRVIEIDLHTQGSLYCQSKLAELTTGLIPFESAPWTPMGDDPEWFYQIEVVPAEFDGLSSVQVAIKFGEADPPQMLVSLSQLLIDPTKRGSTLDQFAPTTPSTTDSSTSSSSSSSSSSSNSSSSSGPSSSGTPTSPSTPTPATGGGGTPSGPGTGGGGTGSGAGTGGKQ